MLNVSGKNQAKKVEVWFGGGGGEKENETVHTVYVGLTGYEQHG